MYSEEIPTFDLDYLLATNKTDEGRMFTLE